MAMLVSPTTSGVIANLEALNLKNYEDWSFRIKTYLLAEDLWDVVDPNNEAPKREHDKAWRKNNAKALYAIQNTCDEATYSFIKGKNSAKEAWSILSEKLEKSYEESKTADATSVPVPCLTPASGDASEVDLSTMEEGRAGASTNEQNNAQKTAYEDFVDHILGDKWDDAMKLRDQYPNLMNETRKDGMTALHCVIMNIKCESEKRVATAKKLVNEMTAESLEARTAKDKCSAIYLVIEFLPEAIDLVKCMYEKNKNIVTCAPFIHMTPLLFAQCSEFGEKMAKYLYTVTPQETIEVPLAAQLITEGFRRQRFDIAWNLIQRHPYLAITKDYDGKTPLNILAGIRTSFLSGSRLGIWERWVYERGASIAVSQNPENHQSNQRRQHHLISSALWIWNGAMSSFWRLVQKLLGPFHRIHKMKSDHAWILEFLKIMCKATEGKDLTQLEDFDAALFLATERGHVEYIEPIARLHQEILFLDNKKGQSVFHFAIECRQEKVYDLIYGLVQEFRLQKSVVHIRGESGNTALHMVGRFSSLAQINRIQGPALQMQRELHWFEKVKSVLSPTLIDVTNEDDMTARELFTKSHKDLVQEGEKSIKDTATSCTVVGALIVTMMFAAAFTVPDVKDEKFPPFLKEKLIKVFLISDAISLFSSTTSVIIFLGILTSRYTEDDFLLLLPTKMNLGLLTLFLAIDTMMIAFSSALYILLHGNLTIIIPVILLSIVPITSFIWLQFPFLIEVLISTYCGPGIFEKKLVKAKGL